MTASKQPPPPTSSMRLAIFPLIAVAFAGVALGLGLHERFLRQGLGMPEGQLQLAQQDYQTGDYQEALALFSKLANGGDPLAEYWLAHMTELGIGTTKDAARAVDLYGKAAAQGNVAAQTRLGEIYLDGNIVPPDFPAARTNLEKAAVQGNARAALLLGQIYRLGLGTPSDLPESFAWLEVATLENNALARHERSELLARLSLQQQDAAVARSKALMDAIKNKTALPAKAAPTSTAAKQAPITPPSNF
jgi:TPR repeat protein